MNVERTFLWDTNENWKGEKEDEGLGRGKEGKLKVEDDKNSLSWSLQWVARTFAVRQNQFDSRQVLKDAVS